MVPQSLGLTLDREPVLVDAQIGRTRWLTPDGFLYCEGVRIARTGSMLYRPDEVPDIQPGAGMVLIERDADVLFAADTIASFNGKPVTNDHPPDFVSPSSWKRDAVGTVLNARRGEGVEAEYLIADLLITDAEAIDAVLAGKAEVSPGYDAPRVQVKPGLGRQIRMTGNHVALVARGRGGPACAIQDNEPEKEPEMAVVKRSAWDRLRTAFKANDEAAFNAELAEAQNEPDGDEPQRIVIEVKAPDAPEAVDGDGEKTEPDAAPAWATAIGDKLDQVIAALGKLAPKSEDEDPEAKPDPADEEKYPAMDAAAEQDVRAKAEIILPGVQMPTLDAAAEPIKRSEAMHGLRIRTLTAAYADPKRKAHVEAALGGAAPNFAALTFDNAALLFNAVAGIAKAANNQSVNLDHRVFPQGPMTTAKLAELHKQRRAG